jgi:hypothetical protein
MLYEDIMMDQIRPTCDVSRNGATPFDAAARIGRPMLAASVGFLGVMAVHHPMILSGFGRIQTDMGDTRLLNYFMEHGWLWVSRAPRHERFWDAPFFHPVPNVMAFSDSMLSYGPFYWPLRMVGLPPDTAFGIWMVAMTVLNYAAGVMLFSRGLGFGAPATTAAAGLIAFGAPRVNQLGRPQLLPFFYLLLALYALCRIARDENASAAERASWWMAFGLTVTAQFYGGYYLGWFFGVGLAVATVAALLLRSSRGRVVALARRDWWAAALGATVAAVAMVPFLAHYLPVAREVGRGFGLAQRYGHPSTWSWWNTGVVNWWWGWIDRRWPVQGTPFANELRLGLGFGTTAACGIGLYLGRRDPLGRVALAATLFTVAAMTFVPNVQIVYIAAAACFALGCLFREPDWTERGGATFVLATAVLLACPPFNEVLRSLTFVMIALCMVRIWDRRGRPSEMTAPGVALAALVFHALPLETAALTAGFFAAAGALAAYFARGRRIEAALVTLGLWLATTTLLSVESRPWIFWQAALGAVFGWAASADRRFRPDPRVVLTIVAATLPIVILLNWQDSLWLAVSRYIPGSAAIRTPARVILVLLVPSALGLAFLVERLDRGRWGAVAWCVALVCLTEQIGTSETYDRDASRRRIAEVARQIDRRADSFYYRPVGDDDYFYYFHLDAMWAAMETGVPTINGISGCFPTGWWALGWADSRGRKTTEEALQGWCDDHGLRRSDVQRIGRQADGAIAKGEGSPASTPEGRTIRPDGAVVRLPSGQ